MIQGKVRTYRRNSRSPGILETLAAAYAAAGRFPEAIATAEKGIGLARAARQTAVVEELIKALDRYRRSLPPGQ